MVERVVLILQCFEDSHGFPLNLADVADLTGLPKSSTFRILQQLVDARLVERDEMEYRLGLGIFELGSLFPHRNEVVSHARAYMQELSSGGRFVAHLAILDGTEVVYLDKVGGAFAGRLPSRIGGRFTAHRTAVGKAILAQAGRGPVKHYFDKMFIERDDPVGLRRLQNDILQVRKLGYASEHGEAVAGVSCVAAAITNGDSAIAAISICGPSEHLDVERLRNRVRIAATCISRRTDNRPHRASA